MNKQLRKFFPKGKSIDHLSKEQVKTFNQVINQTRIASLSGATPDEALARLFGKDCLDILNQIII